MLGVPNDYQKAAAGGRGPDAAHTFLVADLAGFTALTEAHGDERAADLVAEFCARARPLLAQYGGEVVKVIGDAMMIRVGYADQAVQLALRLAREVGGRHGFPAVRVGLHSGPAVRRGNDWFGATVNLAARVSSIASSGEVLTDPSRRAAEGILVDLEFRSRGPQRFKNVSEPVEVFVVAPRGEDPPGRLAIDPVCRMAVDPDHAGATRERGGRVHVFSTWTSSRNAARTLRPRALGRSSARSCAISPSTAAGGHGIDAEGSGCGWCRAGCVDALSRRAFHPSDGTA